MAITFEQFEKEYLIKNLKDKRGNPKHTRFIKRLFDKFALTLLDKHGVDIYTCKHCGIFAWNGESIVIEMDHINGKTSDSRLSNLRFLCPNCHSLTPNYKGRKS